MSRLPRLEQELKRLVGDISGIDGDELRRDASFVEQGLDSLALTQAALEIERVFGIKLRFRRLLEDLGSIDKLAAHLNAELPAERFAPPAQAPVAPDLALTAWNRCAPRPTRHRPSAADPAADAADVAAARAADCSIGGAVSTGAASGMPGDHRSASPRRRSSRSWRSRSARRHASRSTATTS